MAWARWVGGIAEAETRVDALAALRAGNSGEAAATEECPAATTAMARWAAKSAAVGEAAAALRVESWEADTTEAVCEEAAGSGEGYLGEAVRVERVAEGDTAGVGMAVVRAEEPTAADLEAETQGVVAVAAAVRVEVEMVEARSVVHRVAAARVGATLAEREGGLGGAP